MVQQARYQQPNGSGQSARRRSGVQPDSAPAGLMARAAAPRHLPAVVSPFVGRAEQLDWLSSVRQRARIRGETTVITISGTAGVGKSALAIRWAHEAAGHFPDGQFYANLRGFDQASTPVLATQAIREFLDAFGVPAERIPASPEAQALLYRSLMADKRVLIILDNARDPDQVRALLPASSGCVVLATSRNALAGLAATHGSLGLTLDEFSESEARELLAARLPRTAGEAEATAEVIELCGRLPLALTIVSARIQCHAALTIADLAAELRGPPVQLEALRAGEAGQAVSVSEVFSWSCRGLTPGAARLFQLMALHPGPDIGVRAAASLAGISGRQAHGLLQELTGAHLLAEHTLSRFAFHDLLRSYAAEQVRANVRNADRRAALRRVLDFYLRTAHSAASRLNRARDPIGLAPAAARVTPEDIGDREQALAWFRAEYRVLLGLIETASETGFSAPAWQLPWCLVNFFDHEGRWPDWVATHQRALTAAQRLGDQEGQAHTRQNLAIAYSHLQRHDDAHAELRDALRLYHELGNPTAEARCRLDIARTFELQGENGRALAEAELALDLYRTLGHRVGIARALNAVGWYCSHLGNFAQAVACCEQALAIHRETGNRLGQAATLDSLGHAHTQLRHYQYAVSCYTEALRLLGEDEHTYQRASVLRWLGSTYRAAGDQAAASRAWREAKTILDELRHPEADVVEALLDQVRSGDLCGLADLVQDRVRAPVLQDRRQFCSGCLRAGADGGPGDLLPAIQGRHLGAQRQDAADPGGVGADRDRAAAVKLGEQSPFRPDGGVGVRVAIRVEHLQQFPVAGADLDGQRALAGRRREQRRVEQLGDRVVQAQPPQPGGSQDHRVQPGLDLRQPGRDVAPDRHDLDIGAQRPQLRDPPRGPGSHPGTRAQALPGGTAERVERVSARRGHRQDQALVPGGGEVLERVNGDVDAPGDQLLLDLGGEHPALAAAEVPHRGLAVLIPVGHHRPGLEPHHRAAAQVGDQLLHHDLREPAATGPDDDGFHAPDTTGHSRPTLVVSQAVGRRVGQGSPCDLRQVIERRFTEISS
jgi:tetratricopeptide (TPR) repeat protein